MLRCHGQALSGGRACEEKVAKVRYTSQWSPSEDMSHAGDSLLERGGWQRDYAASLHVSFVT